MLQKSHKKPLIEIFLITAFGLKLILEVLLFFVALGCIAIKGLRYSLMYVSNENDPSL